MQNRLSAWLSENADGDWANVGLKVVQWSVNSVETKAHDKIPYEFVFGQKPTCGISDLPFSDDLIARLQTEDALADALDGLKEAVFRNTGTAKTSSANKGSAKAKQPAIKVPVDCDDGRALLAGDLTALQLFDRFRPAGDHNTAEGVFNGMRLTAVVLSMPVQTSKSTRVEGKDLCFEVSMYMRSPCAASVSSQ